MNFCMRRYLFYNVNDSILVNVCLSANCNKGYDVCIYPTPPHEQDATNGHFFTDGKKKFDVGEVINNKEIKPNTKACKIVKRKRNKKKGFLIFVC